MVLQPTGDPLPKFDLGAHNSNTTQFRAYISILAALSSAVSSAPTTATADAAVQTHEADIIKKSTEGRFKPVWVIGFGEDEKKGEHIGFRLFKNGEEDVGSHAISHDGHPDASDADKKSFWYYY